MKKLVLVLLLMIPFVIYAAECDKEKHKEYVSLSNSITYDNNYIKSSNTFTITIYNVVDGMYAEYKEKKYTPGEDSTIVVPKIPCGEKVSIEVYGDDNCTALKKILLTEPYFNRYYGSSLCNGYEEKLVMCNSQFTNIEVTKSLLEKSIYNYNHSISQKTTKDVDEAEEETLASKLMTFMTTWGIKILLAFVSTVFSISLFSDKYRKVKHGI